MLAGLQAKSQLTISGTVYDSSRIIPVRDVVIKSSSNTMAITDSNGHYDIVVRETDSLTFIYNYKPTAKFSVKQVNNIGAFDISLHIHVANKFKTLKEVRIYTKSFRQDSVENRRQYDKVFNYSKPGISLTSDANTGAAGLDVNELINIFRFKRNRQLQRMQQRLLEQEKDNYINYRFNKVTIRRITHLDGIELETFMNKYRPDFTFTESSNMIEFYQYILNASYQYKKELLMKKGR